jgi:hypothetical protein
MHINFDKLTSNNHIQNISHFHDSIAHHKFNHQHIPFDFLLTSTSNSHMKTNSLDSSLETVVSLLSNTSSTSSPTNETLNFNCLNNQHHHQFQTSNENSQLLVARRNENFVLNEITYRSLCPQDKEELKVLCQEWFPVELVSFHQLETFFELIFKLISLLDIQKIGTTT